MLIGILSRAVEFADDPGDKRCQWIRHARSELREADNSLRDGGRFDPDDEPARDSLQVAPEVVLLLRQADAHDVIVAVSSLAVGCGVDETIVGGLQESAALTQHDRQNSATNDKPEPDGQQQHGGGPRSLQQQDAPHKQTGAADQPAEPHNPHRVAAADQHTVSSGFFPIHREIQFASKLSISGRCSMRSNYNQIPCP